MSPARLEPPSALAENLTDRGRQLVTLRVRRGQLRGGGRNSCLNGRAQRPLLIGAQHPGDQLLAAGIGDQPNQPPQQVIDDKHASILPSGPWSAHTRFKETSGS